MAERKTSTASINSDSVLVPSDQSASQGGQQQATTSVHSKDSGLLLSEQKRTRSSSSSQQQQRQRNSSHGSRDRAHHYTGTTTTSSASKSCRSSRSTSPTTGSARDLSPPLLRQLAQMNVDQLARRPAKPAMLGRLIACKANFYEVTIANEHLLVTQYHINIEHPGNRKLDKDEHYRIFWTLVDQYAHVFKNRHAIAYDGAHQLYVVGALHLPEDKATARLQGQVVLAKDAREKTLVTLHVQSVGPVLLDVSLTEHAPPDQRLHLPIQITDVVFRQRLTSSPQSPFYPYKSSFYRIVDRHDRSAVDLGGGKQMWAGFFASAQAALNGRVLLNIDVSHSAFYKYAQPMLEYMCDVLNERALGGQQCRPQDLPYSTRGLQQDTRLSNSEGRALTEALKGLKVRVSHSGGKARVYRVNSLAAPADQLTFIVRSEEEGERSMSVAQYFAQRYHKLRYPGLPCLHVGPPNRNIYFPLEVCTLDGPQKYNRKLCERQTSTVIKAAAVDAITRQTQIASLVNAAGYHDDPFLQSFGFELCTTMVDVDARVLSPPSIQFNAQSGQAIIQPTNGAWETNGQILLQPATCRSYALIALVPQKEQNVLVNFCSAFHRRAIELGMRWPQWPDCVRYGQSKEDVTRLYQEILQEYRQSLSRACDLVLLVMPYRSADVYAAVKEASDVHTGVMSQCILWKNVQKASPATCANLVLKVNMKLGGVNSRVTADDIAHKWIIGQPTLLLGIDVTHPTAVEERQGVPSIAAITGNIDLHPMAYGANARIQRRTREPVVYLLDAVRERLVAFYKSTGEKPTRIVVYRDGVSDSQFQEVLREEMQGIRTACLMLSPDYRPPITYIVVQKRHHARLFCANPRDAVGRCKNIPPGTTVDTEICTPNSFDFYLCSHFGIQGTSRPTRYSVLWDDNKFDADELQSLTYTLCHMYGRCTRAVSIPAPVYYAHLVAARARVHLKSRLHVTESESAVISLKQTKNRLESTSRYTSTVHDEDDMSTLHAPSTIKAQPGKLQSKQRLEAMVVEADRNDMYEGDSALQDAVQVVDKFKARMYYV